MERDPDRQGQRLMGKYSGARHTHTASSLPQVSVFTHQEHLNFILPQKHVSGLTRLSVTPQHADNSTRVINVKLQRCANLPPISCLQYRTRPITCVFFSIMYEACHFPCQKASPYQQGMSQFGSFGAHPNLVF